MLTLQALLLVFFFLCACVCVPTRARVPLAIIVDLGARPWPLSFTGAPGFKAGG